MKIRQKRTHLEKYPYNVQHGFKYGVVQVLPQMIEEHTTRLSFGKEGEKGVRKNRNDVKTHFIQYCSHLLDRGAGGQPKGNFGR